jgi:hypothetical protein
MFLKTKQLSIWWLEHLFFYKTGKLNLVLQECTTENKTCETVLILYWEYVYFRSLKIFLNFFSSITRPWSNPQNCQKPKLEKQKTNPNTLKFHTVSVKSFVKGSTFKPSEFNLHSL